MTTSWPWRAAISDGRDERSPRLTVTPAGKVDFESGRDSAATLNFLEARSAVTMGVPIVPLACELSESRGQCSAKWGPWGSTYASDNDILETHFDVGISL